QVFSFFSSIKIDIGQLTRNRLERITRKLLKDQQYAQAIGNKLVVIRGRAGTGKTIKLLHVAYELCQRDHRCLILTYNKALVSDIKRLIALAGIKDDIATATIEVKTIHSFMHDILIGFGILNKSITEAVEKYILHLRSESHLEEEEILREVARFKEQYFLKEYEFLKDE
ncbi:DNA/RNA helicase domain-containing protein, partial [Mycobacterium tuberculosis]